MATDTELRAMLIDTLNESDPPLNWTEDSLTHAIRLAKIYVFTVIGEGSQEQFTGLSDGSTKIRINDDLIRIIRVDSLGDDCGLEKYTVETADQLKPAWRGCKYVEGEEPTGYVLDPDTPDALWIFPAPAPGVEVKYTALSADTSVTTFPDKLLNAIRHQALSYLYERIYGNNHNANHHRDRAMTDLRIMEAVNEENSNG